MRKARYGGAGELVQGRGAGGGTKSPASSTMQQQLQPIRATRGTSPRASASRGVGPGPPRTPAAALRARPPGAPARSSAARGAPGPRRRRPRAAGGPRPAPPRRLGRRAPRDRETRDGRRSLDPEPSLQKEFSAGGNARPPQPSPRRLPTSPAPPARPPPPYRAPRPRRAAAASLRPARRSVSAARGRRARRALRRVLVVLVFAAPRRPRA